MDTKPVFAVVVEDQRRLEPLPAVATGRLVSEAADVACRSCSSSRVRGELKFRMCFVGFLLVQFRRSGAREEGRKPSSPEGQSGPSQR